MCDAKVSTGDHNFYLCYKVTCGQQVTFLTELVQILSHQPCHSGSGHFTSVVNPNLDRLSSFTEPRSASLSAIPTFVANLDLEDIYRKRNHAIEAWNHFDTPSHQASRVSWYFSGVKHISHHVTNASVFASNFSDHNSATKFLVSRVSKFDRS